MFQNYDPIQLWKQFAQLSSATNQARNITNAVDLLLYCRFAMLCTYCILIWLRIFFFFFYKIELNRDNMRLILRYCMYTTPLAVDWFESFDVMLYLDGAQSRPFSLVFFFFFFTVICHPSSTHGLTPHTVFILSWMLFWRRLKRELNSILWISFRRVTWPSRVPSPSWGPAPSWAPPAASCHFLQQCQQQGASQCVFTSGRGTQTGCSCLYRSSLSPRD